MEQAQPACSRLLSVKRWLALEVRALALTSLTIVAGVLLPTMASAGVAWPVPLSAQVLRVVDGDTLLLETNDRHQLRVRLLAVDAPELQQARGQQARTALSALAANRRVRIGQIERNAYGEYLAVVWVDPPGRRCAAPPCDPNLDLGRVLIAEGQAWHQPAEAGLLAQDQREAYMQAELMAKLRRLGLWQDAVPQAPWLWRQRQGS